MGGHDHDNRKYHIGQALVWLSVWDMIVAIVWRFSAMFCWIEIKKE
jgi:hypothetical protein